MLLTTEQIPSRDITASSLPVVAKIVGFVVSWAGSIYFLWVRKQPKILDGLPFFEQTQRVSIVVTSIFLMLTWGALATSSSLQTLTMLAIALTTIGIVVYFGTIYLTIRAENGRSAISAARTLLLLVCFLVYTASVSCGLTSAGVFLAVLLTNPANAATGTTLTKAEEYTVMINVSGKIVTTENQEVPFRVSSGQGNFGCEENRSFRAEYTLPQGAMLVGSPTPSFLNMDNAKLVVPPSVTEAGASIAATGTLRGLDYQTFPFGVRNCPGGGHGELVLSGIYRSSINHEQEVTRVLTNDLSSAAAEPVIVTLPDFDVKSVEAICKPKSRPDGDLKVVVSPEHPSSSTGPCVVNYLPQKRELSIFLKL